MDLDLSMQPCWSRTGLPKTVTQAWKHTIVQHVLVYCNINSTLYLFWRSVHILLVIQNVYFSVSRYRMVTDLHKHNHSLYKCRGMQLCDKCTLLLQTQNVIIQDLKAFITCTARAEEYKIARFYFCTNVKRH